MTVDITDIALIVELRSKLEQAGNELEAWQRRAQTALQICSQAQSELAELRAATAAEAERANEMDEAKSSSFWHAMWKEATRRRREDGFCIAALDREIQALGAELDELRCGDLVRFSDGELTEGRAERFRAHLNDCADCRAGLVAHRQLDARLSELAAKRLPR